MNMPAISLAAVRGRRQQTLDVAAEIERRGFTGIYCPSMGDCVALCQGIASVTNEIIFGTSVQPIYFRNAEDLAATAAFIHEISDGRFRLGIGVTHGPVHQRLGITPGKPLADIREYVSAMQRASETHGELPPPYVERWWSFPSRLGREQCGLTPAATTSITRLPTSLRTFRMAIFLSGT